MRTKITKALDECLAMMSEGESIDACLAKHEDVKKQLEPLLNTALSISSLPRAVPSDNFKETARERLIARLRGEAKQAKTVELKQGLSFIDDLAIAAQQLRQAFINVKKVAVPVALGLLIIIVASFSASNFLTPSTALASGCTLSILSGDVEVQVSGEDGRQGVDGMTLDIGTRVRTTPDASALLTFFDGSTLKLEPGTDVEIQELKYNEEKAITIVLKQWMGRTWSRVVKMADAGSYYEIETPSACAVVRGTLFTTEVDVTGSTTVATTEGLVSVVAQGEEVYVPASQQTHVESGAVPSQSLASPPPVAQIIINVDAPAIGSVIDPSGASTGLLPGGLSINQISGSRSLFTPAGKQVITIPQPRSGEYTLALRYVTEGLAHFNIQGMSDGDVSFEYAGQYEGLSENGWLIHITVRVVNGRITDSQVSEVETLGFEGPEKLVKTESAQGRAAANEAIAQPGKEKPVQAKGAASGPDATQSQGNGGQGQDNGVHGQYQHNYNTPFSNQGQGNNEQAQPISEQAQAISEQSHDIGVQAQAISEQAQSISEQAQAISEQAQTISEQGQDTSNQSQSIDQSQDSNIPSQYQDNDEGSISAQGQGTDDQGKSKDKSKGKDGHPDKDSLKKK
jgi:hypothetical protein